MRLTSGAVIAEGVTLARRPGIGRSVVWNYLGAGYEALAGMALVGYVVRRISVVEYGLLLFAMSVCPLMFLLDLGLGSILVQAYVAAAKDSAQRLSDLLSTALVVLFGMGTLGILVFAAIALNLPGPFNIPRAYVHEASIVFLLVAFATQTSFPIIALEYAYQAFHRFDRINQLQVATVTVRIALTVAFLAAGYGVVALALVQALASLLRLLGLWIALRWSVPAARLDVRLFDWALMRPLLRPGAWAVLNNVVGQLARASDMFILGIFGSMSSVALFGLGNKLPAQLSNMVTRGAMVILPSLAQHNTDADQRGLRRVYLNAQRLVFTGALPVVALGFICARALIVVWAGSAYIGATPVMQWLLLAGLSLAMSYSSDLLLYARGEIRTAARIASFESVANVALSLVLVFRYGAAGLAAGTAITRIAANLFGWAPAACRAAGIRLPDLARAVTAGDAVALALLAVETLIIGLARQALPPAGVVVAGVIAGVIYLAVWAQRTAIPLWRLRDPIAGRGQA